MEKQKWTKKDKIACSIIFAISITIFVVFFSSMTLSYFFDTHSASDLITAGSVSISLQGGPNGDGQIKFPEVLNPNSTYNVSDYVTGSNYDMGVSVKNTSTSGPVFIMVKLESEYLKYLRPVLKIDSLGNYWIGGTTTSDSEYYLYYMNAVGQGVSTEFICNSWQMGDYSRALSGSQVTMKITAYAIQSQGGAVLEMIAGNVDGWQNAPQLFVKMVEEYSA